MNRRHRLAYIVDMHNAAVDSEDGNTAVSLLLQALLEVRGQSSAGSRWRMNQQHCHHRRRRRCCCNAAAATFQLRKQNDDTLDDVDHYHCGMVTPIQFSVNTRPSQQDSNNERQALYEHTQPIRLSLAKCCCCYCCGNKIHHDENHDDNNKNNNKQQHNSHDDDDNLYHLVCTEDLLKICVALFFNMSLAYRRRLDNCSQAMIALKTCLHLFGQFPPGMLYHQFQYDDDDQSSDGTDVAAHQPPPSSTSLLGTIQAVACSNAACYLYHLHDWEMARHAATSLSHILVTVCHYDNDNRHGNTGNSNQALHRELYMNAFLIQSLDYSLEQNTAEAA